MAQLSQPITYRTLLVFAVPMIVSQLFMNVNFIVDGFFVAHAVGTDGLSAINIVMPFIPLTIVLATMLGTGGSALVAAQLGAGENRHARENFSLLVLVCVILSTMIAARFSTSSARTMPSIRSAPCTPFLSSSRHRLRWRG